MREILFRGKRIDNGKWEYGGCVSTENEVFLIYNQTHSIDLEPHTVEKRTIGQYTGLTDKNGKKIFEGDIVRTHYANALKAVFVETVVFDGGKFCATSTNEGCKTTAALWDGVPRLAIDKSVYMDEVEVIGNIHDDPELLEVGNEPTD